MNAQPGKESRNAAGKQKEGDLLPLEPDKRLVSLSRRGWLDGEREGGEGIGELDVESCFADSYPFVPFRLAGKVL